MLTSGLHTWMHCSWCWVCYILLLLKSEGKICRPYPNSEPRVCMDLYYNFIFIFIFFPLSFFLLYLSSDNIYNAGNCFILTFPRRHFNFLFLSFLFEWDSCSLKIGTSLQMPPKLSLGPPVSRNLLIVIIFVSQVGVICITAQCNAFLCAYQNCLDYLFTNMDMSIVICAFFNRDLFFAQDFLMNCRTKQPSLSHSYFVIFSLLMLRDFLGCAYVLKTIFHKISSNSWAIVKQTTSLTQTSSLLCILNILRYLSLCPAFLSLEDCFLKHTALWGCLVVMFKIMVFSSLRVVSALHPIRFVHSLSIIV